MLSLENLVSIKRTIYGNLVTIADDKTEICMDCYGPYIVRFMVSKFGQPGKLEVGIL